MTYCVGFLLDEGLVMMADTRTNAGVDNFSSFKKLHTLVDEPDRQIYACSSGSLSMSQAAISLIQEGLPATGEGDMVRTLSGCTSMFRAAQLIGETVQIVNRTVGEALASIHISSSVSLLLGGRIGDAPPALYLIYSAGNFIECKSEVPFLQIGETKYGKPILDRGIRMETPLDEAVKIGLISFASTIRSNLGVARPIDILVLPRDRQDPLIETRVEHEDSYFDMLSRQWSDMLRDAVKQIPNPPFMREAAE